MNVVIEGTPQQIENFKELKRQLQNDLMPDLREDYQTHNLWSIRDVQSRFKCNDKEAMELLEKVMHNDSTMNHIWLVIEQLGEERGFKKL